MSARRKRRPPTRTLILALAVALLGLTAVLWLLLGARDRANPEAGDFGDRLVEMARSVGATEVRPDDPIRKEDEVFVRVWRIRLPSAETARALASQIEAEAASRQASVTELEPGAGETIRLRVDLGVEAFDLRLEGRRPLPQVPVRPLPTATQVPSPQPSPLPSARGRLAILLDDAGQSLDLVAAAAALPPEVGVAVLPFLPESSTTAAEVHRAGHEVWLHLPMEPETGNPGPGAVLVAMKEQEIRATVRAALNSVPHVVGVNNHMGSRATADLRTMTWVMQELAARGLAFIDSRTSVATVAEDAARAQGVRAGRRLVFLDNERTASAVRAQLDEAVYRARIEGRAIAIGHLTRVTVEVLENELPGLGARGADLVKPSQLTR